MARNYLVSAVRPIRQGWHLESNRDLFDAYHQMYHMMLASWQAHSKQEFTAILLTDPVENNLENNVRNWEFVKQLWHSEPSNIVWAGADTLMVQPTEIFGAFPQYRLFNYTEPKTHPKVANYFNDDLQYYPHTMNQDTWCMGDELLENIYTDPEGNWGYDQIRHNLMFWHQTIDDTDRHHPKLAWQAMRLRELAPTTVAWHEWWNNCPLASAQIIHFHASRGSQAVIDIMRQICDKLGIKHAAHT